jgi:3',5'-cyclic AMP phosphodiesterase CpdA
MPIHLGPIPRRRFLSQSLVAGAGLVLSRDLFASQRTVDENSWALLSDTHLAEDRGKVNNGVNMAGSFGTVSRELLALAERPAGLLITGDLAYSSGEKGDYAMLAELLEPLRREGYPVHLILGNHDHRERFWEGFPKEKAVQPPVPDRQMSLVTTPLANWYLLDSLEKTNSTPGLLGREQLDWLAKTLDAHPDKPALVAVHHNPGLSGNQGLKDTALLYEVIRPRKQVKAYIYGHTHVWKVEQDSSGIHQINLPAVSYVFSKGEPSGWVNAKLRANGMQLELRCVVRAHKDHGEIKNLQWRS